mmetsp:Transcript_92872/g.233484  ORF Transcript_92872/g.233484 Transcript_92872/m.233484 type:complete len:216 (-) Transcript_92872:56-703(-)
MKFSTGISWKVQLGHTCSPWSGYAPRGPFQPASRTALRAGPVSAIDVWCTNTPTTLGCSSSGFKPSTTGIFSLSDAFKLLGLDGDHHMYGWPVSSSLTSPRQTNTGKPVSTAARHAYIAKDWQKIISRKIASAPDFTRMDACSLNDLCKESLSGHTPKAFSSPPRWQLSEAPMRGFTTALGCLAMADRTKSMALTLMLSTCDPMPARSSTWRDVA